MENKQGTGTAGSLFVFKIRSAAESRASDLVMRKRLYVLLLDMLVNFFIQIAICFFPFDKFHYFCRCIGIPKIGFHTGVVFAFGQQFG